VGLVILKGRQLAEFTEVVHSAHFHGAEILEIRLEPTKPDDHSKGKVGVRWRNRGLHRMVEIGPRGGVTEWVGTPLLRVYPQRG
jgi:hypothetical protein